LVRLGGGNTLEEILNEERAVVKLSQSGVKNIVAVLQFGFLENSPNYYFLDMELCDINLGSYILGELPTEIHASFNVDASNRMVQVWKIMLDICNGVKFIHDHQEVHRDLKPNNGTYQAIISNL
jgi:serine/threonine protein kinase